LRKTKIKTKLIFSFVTASIAAIMIGLCGYLNVFHMNDIINYSDYNVVKPLAYLDQITFCTGRISIIVRDIMLDGNGESQETQFELIRTYQEELRDQINNYLDALTDNRYTDAHEREIVSDLSVKVSDWSNEMENIARISSNGNTDDALEQLYTLVLPKGNHVNDLIDQLVTINNNQATQRREEAQSSYVFSTVLIITLIVFMVTVMVILGIMVTTSITKSVKKIIHSAEDFAEGNLHFDYQSYPDDEIGQIARALKKMAESIAALIQDNYTVIVEAGAGKLDARVDTAPYKGDYRKILEGINMTFETFCRHLDGVPVAISFFDLSGWLVYSNEVMHEVTALCGFSENNQHLLANMLTSGESDQLPENAAEIFSNEEDISYFNTTVTLKAKDSGETYAYGLTLHRVFGVGAAEGKASCVMLSMVDITEVTDAKRNAEHANRAKTEFLSHMSHEIRTPMNAITGMTQIARRTDDLGKIKDCLDKIESSSHHLLGVLNDVLDMSKIEAGKLALSEDETKLSEDISVVVSMMKSRDSERGVDISYELDIKRDMVMVDSLRLNQVLINLLSNALKFSPDHSQIKVFVDEEPEGEWSVYRFSVEDQGIGMNEEQVGRLFKSFEQADVSITKRFGGTGLGLSISKSIVEMMNGRIWVESEVGKGSIFYFTVRLKTVSTPGRETSNALPVRPEKEDSAGFDLSGLRALVADDIDINRMIIVELLADTGIKIEEAGNGREAANLFGDSPADYFDIILMDIQMPEMDGLEATKVIRGMNRADAKTVPVVALTANVIKEDIAVALAAGMNDHIAKPIERETTIETIHRLCVENKGVK